jgi:hypothetical protein
MNYSTCPCCGLRLSVNGLDGNPHFLVSNGIPHPVYVIGMKRYALIDPEKMTVEERYEYLVDCFADAVLQLAQEDWKTERSEGPSPGEALDESAGKKVGLVQTEKADDDTSEKTDGPKSQESH